MLVSDPQTPIASPSIWYEWQLTGDTLNVRGIGIAGTPALLLGFNESLAWGLTAAGTGNSDIFRLDMDGDDHYFLDGVSHTIESEVETILVKGRDDLQVTWRNTEWGPIVTDLVPQNQGDEWAFKGLPIHHKEGDSIQGALGFMRATTIDELRQSLDDWHYPAANLFAASDTGDIFFTVIGDIPLRSTESPLGGMIAQEGSSMIYDWEDVIPAEYRPWVLNPDQGYLLSANHRAAGDWYPMPLAGGSGSAGHGRRSARLLELMEALPETVEPEQVLDDVQNDCVNRVRRDLVALARHVAQVDDRYLTQDTLAFLDATAAWSATGGSMITDVEGVSLAYAINTKFRKDTIGDEMLNEYGGADNGLNLFLDTMQGEIDADPHFIPDLNELAYLNLALGDVWREFEERDIDVATMDEGYVQSASKDITLFASPLSGLGLDLTGVTIIGPTAACQDAGTIWSQHAQSYTQYVDFQSADSARAIMPPGNSENSDGEWFENQQDDWVDGTLLPAPLAPAFPTSNTPAVQLFWDAD